jgi:hypothetical protein
LSSDHFTPRVDCCSRVLLLNAEVVYMYIYMNVQWPLKWSVIKSNKEIMMMALIIRRGNYLNHMQLISWDSWGSEWSSCFQILWLTDLAISTTVFAACMSTYWVAWDFIWWCWWKDTDVDIREEVFHGVSFSPALKVLCWKVQWILFSLILYFKNVFKKY